MIKVVARHAMQAIDRQAAAEYGVPTLLLMENAGAAVARRAAALLGGRLEGRRIVVVAGPGNNGGDGLVAARRLAAAGARVRVVMAVDGGPEQPRLSEDAAVQYRLARAFDLQWSWVDEEPPEAGVRLLGDADLVVDAVLGTGSRGAPRGKASRVIEWMAQAGRPTLAVDIPSGVDADTGQVPGPAVRCVETVTFGAPKPGLLTFPGAAFAGRIWVAEIGFPPALIQGAPAVAFVLDAATARAWLPDRPLDAHKGRFGHVLVVAGSRGMIGAGALAARAALVAGAGLVTWAVPASLQDVAAGLVPEALTAALPDAGGGCLAREADEAILGLLASRDVLLVGPGLGTHPETARAVRAVVRAWDGPMVVDADGINILAAVDGQGRASDPAGPDEGRAVAGPWGASRTVPAVLTPHPGEMARLLGWSVAQVQDDRLAAAGEAARRLQAVVALKGARTVIATPAGDRWINPTASPALATGGSGDVLAGMVAGLMAQGAEPSRAAACACFVHGLAAYLAAGGGEVGITATDLAGAVGEALRALRRGDPMPPEMEPVVPLPL